MQKSMAHISIKCDLKDAFEAITNHEMFLSGGGLKCRLVEQGKIHKNGVGAIREVRSGKLTLIEHITEYESQLRMSYKIMKTTPKKAFKHHKGWLDFRFADGHSHIHWHSHFEITLPIIGPVIGFFIAKQVEKVFQSRLNFTKKLLEK